MTGAAFKWTPGAIATLRRMYFANATRKQIGDAVGCREAQVARKIEGLRLVDEATPEQRQARKDAARASAHAGRRRQLAEQGRLYDWTPDRIEQLQCLLLVEKLTYDEAAARMGASRSVVVRQAERSGIAQARDREDTARRRREAAARGREVVQAHRAERGPVESPRGAQSDADDRAMIEAAIAAGRVTRLELDIGFTAQPPRPQFPTQEMRKRRAA